MHTLLGFPCGSAGKESACNEGDLGSIPGLEDSLEKGTGYPLQYSGLENSMDSIVHGVAKSRIRLSNFHLHTLQAAGPSTRAQCAGAQASQWIGITWGRGGAGAAAVLISSRWC